MAFKQAFKQAVQFICFEKDSDRIQTRKQSNKPIFNVFKFSAGKINTLAKHNTLRRFNELI